MSRKEGSGSLFFVLMVAAFGVVGGAIKESKHLLWLGGVAMVAAIAMLVAGHWARPPDHRGEGGFGDWLGGNGDDGGDGGNGD